MKKSIFILSLVLVSQFAFSQAKSQINIGDKAPLDTLRMMGVDGRFYNLMNIKGPNGLIVIFSCNTCPFVIGWEDQYNVIFEEAREAGLGMVLINSNEAFRNKEDSFEAMKAHAEKNKYKMPYLVDKNHQLADAFGAQTTPHVFVFDKDMLLVFKGSINDKYENSRNGEKPTKFYLQDVIRSIKSGQPIVINESRAIGCSIKRVSK
ncbi:MAG: thioredoxin family protein [Thermaurantimonas sp.]